MSKEYHNPNHCDIPDVLPGIVYRCLNDEARTMLFMSDKSVDLLGYTLEEVNKISFNKIINKETRERVRETINKALDKKEAFKITYSVTTKNGGLLWIEEHGRGIINDSNKACIEGYIHDITEQVEYKKEHKKELKKLERAENLGLTGNWEFNLNTRQVYTSKGARAIYELDNQEYSIEFVQKIPRAKYRVPLNKALKQLIDGTKPYHLQFEIKGRKSGKIKSIESIAQFDKKTNKVYGVIKDITQRKRLQVEFEKTNTSFKTLYENIPVGVASYSPDGTLVMINNEGAQNLGGTPIGLTGKKLWDFLDEEMADFIYKRIKDCAESGKKLNFKDTMTLHGIAYTFQSYFTPIVFANEDKTSVVQISSTNISELENTKNTFHNLTQRLNIANQAVKNGIWDWNLKTDALYWDDLMYEIYGIKKTDKSLNYQNWETDVVNEDLEIAKQKIDEAIENKEIIDFQFRINHPQKGIRHIKAFAKYVMLNEPHLIGINYDNTERVTNRLKLSQSEELFRKLFEQNNDIITILSPEGKLLNMNEKGLHVYGIKKENLTNYCFADFTIDSTDKNHAVEIIKSLNNHKLISPYHKQFKVRDNRIVDFEISVSPIYNETGKLQRIVTILRDISDRIAYKNEVLEQSQKAQESDRLKTAFLMNMSHEIRTPLNAVMGFSDILKDTKLDNDQETYIQHIQKGSNRIVNTITDLIEASQLQQKQFKVSLEEVDILSLVNEVYYTSKDSHQHQLSSIEYSFNTNISEDIIISTDGERLQAILARIIDNAFKFTKKGGIVLECLLIEQAIEINIKDSGAGIEKEKMQLIFDFFRQGDDSLTRGYEGLGLGLPIAKGILELMGGEIDIISEPDVGTNISIKLPLKTQHQEVLRFEKPARKAIFGNCNVLLVEDDEDSSRYIELILGAFDAKLSIARDSRSCKSMIKIDTFNIVFVDIKLPDASGLDLIPLIRKKMPDSHIIVQSAYTDHSTIEQAMNSGADTYLTKPVNRQKVIEIVKQCTNGVQ